MRGTIPGNAPVFGVVPYFFTGMAESLATVVDGGARAELDGDGIIMYLPVKEGDSSGLRAGSLFFRPLRSAKPANSCLGLIQPL
jgi:hypothetical protein